MQEISIWDDSKKLIHKLSALSFGTNHLWRLLGLGCGLGAFGEEAWNLIFEKFQFAFVYFSAHKVVAPEPPFRLVDHPAIKVPADIWALHFQNIKNQSRKIIKFLRVKIASISFPNSSPLKEVTLRETSGRQFQAIAAYDTNLGSFRPFFLYNQKWHAGKLHQEDVKFTKQRREKKLCSLFQSRQKCTWEMLFY